VEWLSVNCPTHEYAENHPMPVSNTSAAESVKGKYLANAILITFWHYSDINNQGKSKQTH